MIIENIKKLNIVRFGWTTLPQNTSDPQYVDLKTHVPVSRQKKAASGIIRKL